jgi:hypothetical protein
MSNVMRDGWINVGPNGAFASSGQAATTPSDIDQFAAALAAHNKRRLVLYFHGGLVGERLGLQQAAFWLKSYEPGSAISVSVVWETGPFEIIAARLKSLHGSKAFKKFLAWILDKVGEHGGNLVDAKGAGGPLSRDDIERKLETPEGIAELDAIFEGSAAHATPRGGSSGMAALDSTEKEVLADRLLADFGSDVDLMEALDDDDPGAEALRGASRNPNARTYSLSPETASQESARDEPGVTESARGVDVVGLAWVAVRVIARTVSRRLNETDHGIYPTVIEELLRAVYLHKIGAWLWGGMKDAAKQMWIDDGEGPGLNGHVGGYLLRRLAEVQKNDPAFRVDVVGHSAGAIAICHMLETIRSKQLPITISSVTFLAPACRLDLFKDAIVRTKAQRRFRMFTMTDEIEQADRLVPVLYPRSLLYFISGALERDADTPLAGMQRHLKSATTNAGGDFDEVRTWLKESHRATYSPTNHAPPPFACGARSHGDFDNDKETVASILKLAEDVP